MSIFTGLGTALRLMLRRDWLFWALWVLILATLMPAALSQYDTMIPPGSDPGLTFDHLSRNPTMLALLGPAFDLHDRGGFVFWRTGGFTTVLAGLAGALGIVRATRAEEEAGRTELLRSGPMGRHTPLLAAVLGGLAGCLLAGACNTVTLIGQGLGWRGSLAAGLAITTTGASYLALGAVAAQVSESARNARAWAAGLGLGGGYLLRAVVDAAGPETPLAPLRWAIPLEWGMLARPFAGERWWVLGMSAGLAAALALLAFWLEAHRDHTAGLLPDRPGRSRGRAGLRGAWGLAARLLRGMLSAWTVGLLIGAVSLGSAAIGIADVFDDSPRLAQLLQRMGGTAELQTAFFIGVLGIFSTVIGMMAVSLLGLLRVEETTGRAELLLATAVPRLKLALSSLFWALLVPTLVLTATGPGLALPLAAHTGDWSLLRDYTVTALALLPGLWLVAGIAIFLTGWLPKAFGVVWAILGWSIFCSWFGALLQVPDWLVKLHPWGRLGMPPRDDFAWLPFGIELGSAVALACLGLLGFIRRDLTNE